MPVIPWVKKLGLLEAKVIAAHCVHIDDGEIHTLEHAGAGVVHNPSSNMKLASGVIPLRKLIDRGVTVALGTDAAPFSDDWDMFIAMRLATYLQKVHRFLSSQRLCQEPQMNPMEKEQVRNDH